MVTVVLCRDAAGMSERRLDLRDAHLAHLTALGGGLFLAAPLIAAASEREITGSLFILAGDSDAARSAIEQDPYFQARIWSACRYHATESRFGMWMPEHREQLAMFAALAPDGRIDPCDPADRYFLFLCREFADGVPPETLQIEHGGYIAANFKRMMAGMRLLAGGDDADAPHGLYIFRARDLAAAQELADAEPYVTAGRWNTELYTLPAVLGTWPQSARATR